ncbi:MAG: hypothetical protein LBD70_00270, partial [Bifidobacteriaceae bacterium]|nr:hypothetical protein [Bifidobacteriaceae bacterium]
DEAITNAIKHGSAKAVAVALDLSGHDAARQLVLTVTNDGLALPDGAQPAGGLAGHQLRLEARGGGLKLGSNQAGETVVTAWLPVPEPAATDQAPEPGARPGRRSGPLAAPGRSSAGE